VRRRRRGCSSCASRPPEPDLDPPRKKRAWPNPTLSSPRRRRSGTGRREQAERPVRPTAARGACRAEPRPAPASLDAREAPVDPAGPSRSAAHPPRQARPSAPDAVRAGAPEDRRRAPRPRRSHPCPDAQRGRPNRPRFDPSCRARSTAMRSSAGATACRSWVIDAAEQSLGTVPRLLRVRERAPPTAGSFGPLPATARGGRAASAQSVPDDLAQLRRCGSRWTPQSTIPGAPLLDLAAPRQLTT
jgi:hypothetical protein